MPPCADQLPQPSHALDATSPAANSVDDWFDPDHPYEVHGTSRDGQAWYCLSLEPNDTTPCVSIGGRLATRAAVGTMLGVIGKVFAKAGPTGTAGIILRGLEVKRPRHLEAVADLLRMRQLDEYPLELELDVGPLAYELTRLLGLPLRSAQLQWAGPDPYLVVRLPGDLK